MRGWRWCRWCRVAPLGLALVALAGCATLPRDPVPAALSDEAMVLDQAPVRYWGDKAPRNSAALAKEKWAQVRATRPQMLRKGARPEVSFLTISGGGADGAFGAGLLVGWTAKGDRPEFEIVTGVSTGALAAPFAFLGPRYDGPQGHVHEVFDRAIGVQTTHSRAPWRRSARQQRPAARRHGRLCRSVITGGGRA